MIERLVSLCVRRALFIGLVSVSNVVYLTPSVARWW